MAVPAGPRLPALLIAILRPVDAAAAGLITVHALANKLHRKDATTFQPQVADQDGIGTLRPAHVANQLQHLAQEPAAVLDRVPLDLTG